MQHRTSEELSQQHHSEKKTSQPIRKKRKPCLWTLRATTSQVSLGTKICSVQHDSCSGLSESWLLPVQLPSDNISRELRQDWTKARRRHLWVRDSCGVRFGSHHRRNHSAGGRPSRLISRSNGGCAWSFSPDPIATAWLQLFFFLFYFYQNDREERKAFSSVSGAALSANGLFELIFIRESELEAVYWMCRSWSTC